MGGWAGWVGWGGVGGGRGASSSGLFVLARLAVRFSNTLYGVSSHMLPAMSRECGRGNSVWKGWKGSSTSCPGIFVWPLRSGVSALESVCMYMWTCLHVGECVCVCDHVSVSVGLCWDSWVERRTDSLRRTFACIAGEVVLKSVLAKFVMVAYVSREGRIRSRCIASMLHSIPPPPPRPGTSRAPASRCTPGDAAYTCTHVARQSVDRQ